MSSPQSASSLPETSEVSTIDQPRFGELTMVVHERTREAILDGTLVAGEEISQVELARQLGVSRTPLREALRLLEREGLVVVRGAHRLVQVSPLSMSDLDELYALRVAGDAMALRLTMPTLRTDDLQRLREDLKIMGSLKSQPPEILAHRRFHARLRSGTGERMASMLGVLFEHAERYQRAYVIRGGATVREKNAEHRAILRACEKGDTDAAVDHLVDHIASTAEALMAAERYAPRALPDAVARAKSKPRP